MKLSLKQLLKKLIQGQIKTQKNVYGYVVFTDPKTGMQIGVGMDSNLLVISDGRTQQYYTLTRYL